VIQANIGAGSTFAFDIDAASTLDSDLRIYNSAWQPIAENDNGAGAGETLGKDPFIQCTIPASGTYYFVVCAAVNKYTDARSMMGRTTGGLDQGAYTLYTSIIPSTPTTPDLTTASDSGV